jgi:hypothetical protein
MTQEIYGVIAGMEKLRVDKTTERELRSILPSLSSEGRGYYNIKISNQADWKWLAMLPGLFFPEAGMSERSSAHKWDVLAPQIKTAYLLGWRNLVFFAEVATRNGVVSSTRYLLQPDVFFGWPEAELVDVRSAHGFRGGPEFLVADADDESPDYRIHRAPTWTTGADDSLELAYTPAAPQALISQAYQMDLHCFWSLWGCDSVRQVVPLLWEKRRSIASATAARLASADPCPDHVLIGRVRTLSDLRVSILRIGPSEIEQEVIRGNPTWPSDYRRPKLPASAKPGDRFLYFSGGPIFESYSAVPWSPSAEAAVREASGPIDSEENRISHPNQ